MKKDIVEIILEAVREAGQDLPSSFLDELGEETKLLDPKGLMDSLKVINIVVATEEKVEERLGKEVSVLNEALMCETESPLRTVGSMADFILEQIKGA